jgi:glycosyltransferase involved in cell wall biosynthesis
MKKKIVSIIVTNYNEEENIREMYEKLVAVFRTLRTIDYEILYVDNDSTDESEAVYQALSKKDKRVKIIYMSRNFGSPQPSFIAGMEYCTGDAAVFMHGDIQDPPEMIAQFVEKWEEGFDVVYGVRKSRRGYGWLWNTMYKGFYYVLNKFSYIHIPLNAGEFSLVDRKVIKELLLLDEYDYYLRCLRAYVGFKQTGIEYIRDVRAHGHSSESIASGFWWAKTILVNFSFKPLEWISTMAFAVTIFAFALLAYDFVAFMLFRAAAKGIPTVVILILFLGGVQLLSLSVIAEYLAKIFLEVKRRPKYIVSRTINISNEKNPRRNHRNG